MLEIILNHFKVYKPHVTSQFNFCLLLFWVTIEFFLSLHLEIIPSGAQGTLWDTRNLIWEV